MKTLGNMAFWRFLHAVGRSVWVKPQAKVTKANKINGFEHDSYGMTLIMKGKRIQRKGAKTQRRGEQNVFPLRLCSAIP